MAGPERLTTGRGQDTTLAVSMDGKKLAFVTRTESLRIWSIPFDAAKGRTTGEGQPVTAAGMDADLPDLTRDGGKLVFRGHARVKRAYGKILARRPRGPAVRR